ncbi:TPA: galactokinase [Corynebacterium striatum]|uniref:galactokinase family protein n=1 Tax=Corynebacterium striatum TaxID=43770 RepID=UPI001A2FA95B|nr:galactokinase family protein [Corynebacterium striatum]HAT6539622.1 galactokinase [Corynebacterium striatum]HBC7267370.1 galactokinase [Corynebacterium striatum]
MPMWSTPSTPAAERIRAAHLELVGTEPAHIASAPATWSLIGEHIDHFGGVTVMGVADLNAAAAVSPRDDGTIAVHIVPAHGETIHDSISFSELTKRAAEQLPSVDSEGQPVIPPAPVGGIAARWGGVAHTMINRQLLSRETAGVDITVVNDIPFESGLGALAAGDVAVALALLGDAEDLHDAPLRARIADVCSQSVGTFAEYPALRARHTAALRGVGETVTIIDYADGSVTQAPHPVTREIAAFAVTVPGDFDATPGVAAIRQRERFIDDACHAFGAESLRLLPDASQRVLDWLKAVHKVHGSQNQPSLAEAAEWLTFYTEENERAQELARALRSRRGADLFPLLNQSQTALATVYGLHTAEKIAELVNVRGARSARSAHAGTSQAVIAFVPATKAENFAADLAEDGLLVVPLHGGEPATTH